MLNRDLTSPKSNVNAFLLCAIFGMLGLHRIYVRKYFTGFLQLFTLGGFLIWALVDAIIILQENFTDSDNKRLRWEQKKGEYAGLKVRFAAHIIDTFIISIACFLSFVVVIFPLNFYINNSFILLLSELEEFIKLIMILAYYTMLTASPKAATIGKEIMRIMVVDKNKNGLSLSHSFARCLSYFFSYITLGIGFLIIGFTKKHRGLHDMIANTYVIYR